MRPNPNYEANRTLLGFFKPLDFAIRLSGENPLREAFHDQNPVAQLAFYHEWVHYLQFISTAFGRQISYARRVTTLMRLRLLTACSTPINLPLAKWLAEKRQGAASLEVVAMLRQLEATELSWSHFHVDWSESIRKVATACKAKPLLNVAYLRQHAPISLDLTEGAFVFSLPTGEAVRFPVSAYQICEFMAFAVEQDLANRQHFRGRFGPAIDGYLAIDSPAHLAYTMPTLYLSQYASLEPVQFDPAFNPLLTGLIVVCFLSLHMDVEYVQRVGDKEGPRVNELGPFRYPGRFLVRLLKCLVDDFNINADRDFIDGNWMRLFDKMCGLISWPSFTGVYKLAWERAGLDLATLGVRLPGIDLDLERYTFDVKGIMKSVSEYNNLGLENDMLGLLAPVLEREYAESLKAFWTIWNMPHAIAFPHTLFRHNKLPLPVIFYPASDGQLMTYRFDKVRLGGDELPFSMLDKESAYSLWVYRHFLDKIWYGQDLGCFWPEKRQEFYDSINYCDYSTKEECLARFEELDPTRNSPGPLDHCVSPEWKQLVVDLLQSCGFQLSDLRLTH